MPRKTDQQAQELMDRGYDLVNDGEYDAALAIGRELLSMKHTSGFEIMALAHAGRDELDSAIDLLQEGIAVAPTVWLLWQLLGSYLSDEGRYAEAHDAYQHALQCPAVDAENVQLNIGIVLMREEKLPEAEETLRRLAGSSKRFRLPAMSSLIDCLRRMEQHSEALALSNTALEEIDEDTVDEVISQIRVSTAHAIWDAERNAEVAAALARAALEADRNCEEALWLIREIESRRLPEGKYFRLIIEGRFDDPECPGRELGFFCTYDVVAETAMEALEYARQFEPVDIQDSISIDEYEVLEDRPNELAGVYLLGHPMAFDPASSDEEDED